MMNTQTPVLTVLVLLVIGSFDMFHAQGYDPPSSPTAPGPPPPFGVAGKEFPPDGFLCNDPASTCNGKTLTCPKECPAMKPADPKAKSCSFDCNTKCEAVCKNTTANCEGVGSACGDPRFIGGDGIVFYFHGKTNQYFTLVSDPNLQINARFIGRRPQGRKKDNTWIQALGFMFGSHTFSVAANKVSKWDDNVDQLTLIYNDSPVFLSEGHLSAWSAPGPVESSLRVERTAETNSVTVTLPHVAEISVSVVPITKEDDRKHNYQIPSDDCFAHLEVQFRFFQLSENVEGVLGQTYRADFQSPVKRGVAMPIMGGEDKYMTSSLLSADCRYCIFSTDSALASAIAVNTNTMECTSKFSHGRGVVCRR